MDSRLYILKAAKAGRLALFSDLLLANVVRLAVQDGVIEVDRAEGKEKLGKGFGLPAGALPRAVAVRLTVAGEKELLGKLSEERAVLEASLKEGGSTIPSAIPTMIPAIARRGIL